MPNASTGATASNTVMSTLSPFVAATTAATIFSTVSEMAQEQATPRIPESNHEEPVVTKDLETTDCLFCPHTSHELSQNTVHMQRAHGLFIPTEMDYGRLALAVEVSTLIQYMHLVISEYHECLFCGIQRANKHAIQQHMMGRGHCRIDLQRETSEWRDFYEDIGGNEDKDTQQEKHEEPIQRSSHTTYNRYPTQLSSIESGHSLQLSCSRTASPRAKLGHPSPRRRPLPRKTHGQQSVDLMEPPSTRDTQYESKTPLGEDQVHRQVPSVPQSTLKSSARAERRSLVATKAPIALSLSQMSTRDRASLLYLSISERRALVIQQFKQQTRGTTAERKYWSKYERRQDRPAVGGKVYIGGG